mmetsp:Transcript_48418/g.144617  ORF Transcript_48418/g.144617 Transcript_48418/m.144617 type:complete len:245 (-) Transcript_48418:841-1575(-)
MPPNTLSGILAPVVPALAEGEALSSGTPTQYRQEASSWTARDSARSTLGAKTQWPRDWFVRTLGLEPCGTARTVFSHHSRRPSPPASVFTSRVVVLPSLRSTLRPTSVGSRPRRKLWPSRADLAACAVSPVRGSNSSRDAEVQSSPLLAIAAQADPAAAAGCVTETPSSRTLLRPLTSPACSSRRLPSSKAFVTRLLNMADEPVNWKRSTSRTASWSTAGSASGVMPGRTSRRPAGSPHSAMSL